MVNVLNEPWSRIERWSEARYVECRLGESQQVDYLIALSRSGAQALQHFMTQDGADPAWNDVTALVALWTDGRSRLSLQSPAMWLEFDGIRGDGGTTAPPSVSVCLVPGYADHAALTTMDPVGPLTVIDEVLEVLRLSPSTEVRGLVAECFRALPTDSRLIHFSVMTGREPPVLKLYGVLPRNQLVGYLRSLGWRGDFDAVSWMLNEAYPSELLGDRLFVDLTVSSLHDVESSILGLAVTPQHLVLGADRDPFRRALLARWCDVGLANREKVDRIHGILADGEDSTRMRRGRFLDLKLVWSRRLGFQAKAYLGFHHQAAELPWADSPLNKSPGVVELRP